MHAHAEDDHIIASDVNRAWLEGPNNKSIFHLPVKSILPENRVSIITVKKTDLISHAFKVLIDNKILSVPVYDVKGHKFVGLIDVIDIVAHAITVLQESELMGGEFPKLVESTERFGSQQVSSISDLSKRNPWKPVDEQMPISAAINRMVRWKVHRIPVVDSSGQLLTLVTQSQMISYISLHIQQLGDLVNKTVADLKLGLKDVVSVTLNSLAIDAFKLIHSKGVSAVAVVNAKNEIVGNISATDLKLIGYDAKMISKLFLTTEEFLKLITPNETFGSGPICVLPSTTFEEVMSKMLMARIHRVYIVDGTNNNPIGVISQQEVLEALHRALCSTK